jgi:CubicO group peptidase (beta-lactamase class C family)
MREDRADRARAAAAILAALVWSTWAFACTGTGAVAEAEPTSPAMTGPPDFADVRERIQDVLESGVASVAVAVVRDGSIVWEEAFGWEDVAAHRRATPHTRYRIGSVSKPFAATAIMILAERGQIDLSAPANRYLGPARLVRRDGDPDDVTIRDLLQHRAGLPSPHVTRYYTGEKRQPPSVEQAIRRYGIVIDPPGQRYAYSNLGYGILAHIVERVSGVRFGDFLDREIFAPLGLADTSLELYDIPRRPSARLYRQGRGVPGYRQDEQGSAALWSSAHDLARFALFHLGQPLRDQKRILRDEGRLAMVAESRPTGGPGGIWGPEWFYGLGWSGRLQSQHNAYGWFGHDGAVPGSVVELRLVPGERLAVAVLANDDRAPTQHILDLVLDAILPEQAWLRGSDPSARPRPAPIEFSAPTELVGTWSGEIHTWSGSVAVRLDIRRRAARIRVDGAPEAPLDALEIFEGRLRGRSPGRLPASDLGDLPYELWYDLRPAGDALVGAAYAADTARLRHFVLPFWMKLRRQSRMQWEPERDW